MVYYEELRKFLAQANTKALGTSQYKTEYLGLKVKVSFGKGRLALVPWIAFLGGDNTISKGIYPVYLLFKDKNLLILAYGVSETKEPLGKWEIPNPLSLTAYFAKMNLGSLKRYGNSYFFRVYDLNQPLNEIDINRDISEIIAIYREN